MTTTSDCGCHGHEDGAAAAAAADASRTVYVSKDAASSAETRTGTTTGAHGATVLEGFHGLNPQDGLFLRAEHLAAIQDYARALSTAVATASGPGVVDGLGVEIVGTDLVVHPGLAISPRGRALRLGRTVTIPLGDGLPTIADGGFWRIEVHWAWGTSGQVASFGSLCADDCGTGGGTLTPWRDEGVEIRIVPDHLPAFARATVTAMRPNVLSSAYFERERSAGGPWLVPPAAGASLPAWSGLPWTDDTPAPDERGVPLALLYPASVAKDKKDVSYGVQVWTARRLVDGTSAHSTWRSRLAMRPWPVFLAQILQFQDELGAKTGSMATLAGDFGEGLDVERLLEHFGHMRELYEVISDRSNAAGTEAYEVAGMSLERMKSEHILESLEKFPHANAAKGSPLAGLTELPPAGYLPASLGKPGSEEAVRNVVERQARVVVGGHVNLSVRLMRADQIADEVLAAQHRDRIPLQGFRTTPEVEILVPFAPADKEELFTEEYGWVAFVRKGACCETAGPERDTVRVAVVRETFDELLGANLNEEKLRKIAHDDVRELSYPSGAWAYPAGDAAESVKETLAGGVPDEIIAVTSGSDPALAAVRAGLFAMSLDQGHPPLGIRTLEGRDLDAILIVAPRAIG
ncbi:hypothetical protein [Demequina mangrovi]|uniref:Uncharacterized protein n=1 Tax=Demequina mangrovi TaxID=1043493 RepID=A0A1H6TQL7_9MICO|nr:hypothetical protein [Demequina mangrovi]SEI82328.1 hypothetical protein SAMN05421637_0108 [Demequina mangrovi]